MAERRREGPDSVRALEREVRALRAQVQRLEQSLAESINTRELVVTEPDGQPRVVISATGDRGAVEVFSHSSGGHVQASVELFATDPVAGSGHHVGIVLARGGDLVAGFETTDTTPPELWIEE